MNREELIKKWLDHGLNSEEQKAFEELDDYADLLKLSEALEGFKSPDYNLDNEFSVVKSRLKPKASRIWIRPLLKITAVLLISFSLFYYNSTLDTEIKTDIAKEISVSLPDNSTVELNAKSTLTYNNKLWSDNREVSLNGEAFFKVAKGSKFDVITTDGKVSVLGTQFNVIQRKNYFEATCYEGLVSVSYKSKSLKLKPGKRFVVYNGNTKDELVNTTKPSWLSNESTFNSRPLKYILNELKRQYDISLDTGNIDLEQLFTGSFTHNDLDLALKSIALPLGITYSKSNSVIVLQGE